MNNIQALAPPSELQRLATLRKLNILDTPPETRFDRITRTAARLFNVPIAVVSLVDENRQWFKSCIGLTDTETPRNVSFCAHAILQDGIFVIEDATADPRFARNSLVTGAPHIRFYAGYPLSARDGSKLGTLCIIDRVPRQMSKADRQALRDLAGWAQTELSVIQSLELQLSTERELLNTILDNIEAGVIALDARGDVAFLNRTARHFAGLPNGPITANVLFSRLRLHSADGKTLLRRTDTCAFRALHNQPVRSEEVVIKPEGGKKRTLLNSAQPLYDPSGTLQGAVVIFHDISSRKQIEEALRSSEERFKVFMDNSPTVAFIKDPQGRYLYVNHPMEKQFNVTLDGMRGKTDYDWLLPDVAAQVRQNDIEVLASRKSVEFIEKVPMPDGSMRYWLSFKFPVWDGIDTYLLGGVAIDISDRMKAEEDLREMTIRDELTGLYNRRQLDSLLQNELASCRIQGCSTSLILLDIDHFKKVNDTYGHPTGDAVLKWLGQSIRSVVRAQDHAARYGGEELAIIMPDATSTGALALAERLRSYMANHPFIYSNGEHEIELSITISLGVATSVNGGISEERLVASADQALYKAKQQGRNRAIIYAPERNLEYANLL